MTYSVLELLVVGHTDNIGALDYNIELSGRRSDAVRSDLAQRYAIGRHAWRPTVWDIWPRDDERDGRRPS